MFHEQINSTGSQPSCSPFRQETEHLKKQSTHVEPLEIKIYNDTIAKEETVTGKCASLLKVLPPAATKVYNKQSSFSEKLA